MVVKLILILNIATSTSCIHYDVICCRCCFSCGSLVCTEGCSPHGGRVATEASHKVQATSHKVAPGSTPLLYYSLLPPTLCVCIQICVASVSQIHYHFLLIQTSNELRVVISFLQDSCKLPYLHTVQSNFVSYKVDSMILKYHLCEHSLHWPCFSY